jgi:hypothetical protein
MEGRKRKFVIVRSDNEDIGVEEEEVNHYEILDEEGLSVLLRLTEK